MMKKILAIICVFNLITALPTFGMDPNQNTEDNTFFGMDLNSNPENNQCLCDVCQNQSPTLRIIHGHSYNIECYHILCARCEVMYHSTLNRKNVWWKCDYCSYYCFHRIDIRLQTTNNWVSGGATLVPVDPLNNNEIRDYINRENVPNPTNQIPRNIKALWRIGYVCAAGVVCYCAYKAYTWWKGEDVQDENADDEQKTSKNEEHIPESI